MNHLIKRDLLANLGAKLRVCRNSRMLEGAAGAAAFQKGDDAQIDKSCSAHEACQGEAAQ